MTTDTATTEVAPLATADRSPTGEHGDLLTTLAQHRWFLRFTVRGLTDQQAAECTTVSALCLGGLIKHVAAAESAWVDFIVGGAQAMAGTEEWTSEATAQRWAANFGMLSGETLAGLLEHYEHVAMRTNEVVGSSLDLDASHRLPVAPWFPPGAHWSNRRTLLHVIAETAQHCGHADIIRESLDGAKTMG